MREMLDQTLDPRDVVAMSFDMEDFDLSRDPEELLLELDALNAAASVVELRSDVNEARKIVRAAKSVRGPSLTPEQHLIDCAMLRIMGETIPPVLNVATVSPRWVSYVTRTVVRAWTNWAEGQADAAKEMLSKLRQEQHNDERVREPTGAVHLMALYFWASAVEALTQGNTILARKLWKRSMEVGSTFGTESSILVQWTYVSSFFPNAS